MDDEVHQGWTLDPAMRVAMRLEHVQKLIEQGDLLGAVVEAEELLDENPNHLEALELLARVSQALGDAEGAVQAIEQLMALQPEPSPDVLAGLAAARLDCCDLDGAITAAYTALQASSELAQAHFVLAIALQYKKGRGLDAMNAMSAARSLDPEEYPFPLALDRVEWEAAVGAALRQVHPRLQTFWDGIAVRLHERPPLDRLTEPDPALSPRVFGLYQGVPDPELDPWQYRPEALDLYTRNLARTSSKEELLERIVHTLEHEALDWLSLSPSDLDAPDVDA